MKLSILYRGPLASCNYGCTYCPFAKRKDSARQLREDRSSLRRFVDWVAAQTDHEIGVLFTPWGEALVRTWYREAIARLTWMPHVWKAAAQSNLSWPLNWIDTCRTDRLGIWATFHPTETSLERFAARVRKIHEWGVSISVGIVGLIGRLHEIPQLRAAIPRDVYVWINAHQGRTRAYTSAELQFLSEIDPLFPINHARHATRGAVCRAGESSFTVDGAGDMRRCHFVADVIGNIHAPDWADALQPRRCPNARCDCHLGHVNIPALRLDAAFAGGILERSPAPGWECSR